MKFPTEKHLHELESDKFGYKMVSKKILDDILLQMELPNTFGFYGNWGSGKTTMLDFIRQHIEKGYEKEYKYITAIYFESWRYEYSDQNDLLFALLSSINKQTGIKNEKWQRLMIDAITILSGVLRTVGSVDLGKVASDLKNFEGKILKEHETWVDKIERFRNDFETIINDVLKKKESTKLIVFIDDLDRCLPENSVKLLEGIKNFLSVNNTLFVLAIDRRIVSEMIEKKYGLHYGYGDEYLMKIIHYYYELPSVALKDVVGELLIIYDIKSSERQKAYIVNFLEIEAREPRIAKHILHQFGMRISLSSKIRKILDDDKEEKSLQYTFVASFLLTRFSKLFSIGDPTLILKNIRDSAAITLTGPNRGDEYSKITEAYNIDPETRNRLESIIIHHPINSGKESSPDKLINDINKLSGIMRGLRIHEV